MNDLTRNLLLWVVVAVVLMVVFQSFSPRTGMGGGQAPTYTAFVEQVDAGNVQRVVISGDQREITYTLRSGERQTVNAPFDRDLMNGLLAKKVEVMLPDENIRRVGQSVAAATLPEIRK